MKHTYLQRVRLLAPFYHGLTATIVGYSYTVNDSTQRATGLYSVLIDHSHDGEPLTFPAKDLEPIKGTT